MKASRSSWILATALVLTLAACSTPGPKPTPTANAAAVACTAAARADARVYEADQTAVAWEALRGELDTVGLKATGEVKTRIETLVTEWPPFYALGPFGTLAAVTRFNQHLTDVGRACNAAGVQVTMTTLPTSY